MRVDFTYIILLLIFCLFGLRLPAQRKSILYRPYHPHLQKATIKEFLDEINAHSGIQIEYASGNLQLDKQVWAGEDITTLGALLHTILAGQLVRTIEKNEKIILIPAQFPIAGDALLPVYSFFGIVTEEGSREPLNDAVIWEPATRKGTVSNIYGYFSLSLPEGRHLLEITYAGYKSKTIEVDLHWDFRSDISLSVREDIPEVIVTGGNGPKKNAGD